MTRQISVEIMKLILLSLLIFASWSDAHGEDEFTRTCSRVIRALRTSDWSAFHAECADEVIFERIQRLYLQRLSPANVKELFGSSDWISNETEPTESSVPNILICHEISMTKKPSKDERHAFTDFCKFVNESYSWLNPPVHQGRNLRGEEDKSLFGPAIEGKVASNFKWRVQLEEISGRWRVRKLITTIH